MRKSIKLGGGGPFQAALLDALPSHIALLDADGKIVAVNESWRRFGGENGLKDVTYGLGFNCVDVCESGDDFPAKRKRHVHRSSPDSRFLLSPAGTQLPTEHPPPTSPRHDTESQSAHHR